MSRLSPRPIVVIESEKVKYAEDPGEIFGVRQITTRIACPLVTWNE